MTKRRLDFVASRSVSNSGSGRRRLPEPSSPRPLLGYTYIKKTRKHKLRRNQTKTRVSLWVTFDYQLTHSPARPLPPSALARPLLHNTRKKLLCNEAELEFRYAVLLIASTDSLPGPLPTPSLLPSHRTFHIPRLRLRLPLVSQPADAPTLRKDLSRVVPVGGPDGARRLDRWSL